MNLDRSEEQQLIAASIERFVERDYPFETRRRIIASPDGYSDGPKQRQRRRRPIARPGGARRLVGAVHHAPPTATGFEWIDRPPQLSHGPHWGHFPSTPSTRHWHIAMFMVKHLPRGINGLVSAVQSTGTSPSIAPREALSV